MLCDLASLGPVAAIAKAHRSRQVRLTIDAHRLKPPTRQIRVVPCLRSPCAEETTVQITITRQQLVSLGACDDALKIFAEQFGFESVTVDWTQIRQIELLLSPIGKYLGWAYERKLLPWWSMVGAPLDGASLNRASLDGASLDGASLNRASLVGASLDGANLTDAKVCLCSNGPCVRLREVLDAAGWVPGREGLLARKPVPAAMP
jgi:hypothetical protein